VKRCWIAATVVFMLGCGDGGEEAGAARGVGEIRVAAIDAFYNPSQPISTIEARFSARSSTRECAKTTHGACEVLDCSGANDVTLSSAGTLSVATADERFQQSIEPDTDGAYVFGEPALLFLDGDSVTVAASGEAVPAFTIDAPFPPTFQAVEPLLTESENTLPIGHQEDLTVRVAGGTPGVVLQAELRGTRATMRCSAPDGSEEVVLPASALEAAGGGVIELRSLTRATARAGAYDVTLMLLAGVMQDDRLLVLTTN
jgi:hypothetical protein